LPRFSNSGGVNDTIGRSAMSRADRDREVVQRTAELLTSSLTLEELFHAVCSLLARFVDASRVFIALKGAEGARIAFAFENGEGTVENRQVHPTSFTAEVLRTGEPLLMRRAEDWPKERELVHLRTEPERAASVSAIFVPLKFGAEIIGVLSVQSAQAGAYDAEDVALLQACGLYLSVRIHQAQLETHSAQLANIASTDSLTGVANRRSFNQRLTAEWRRAIRRSASLALILIDIDFFKPFNDTYGHVAGDAALQQVATALASCLSRSEDVFARYGGEEFIAILPETNLAGALTIAERMRQAVADLGIAHGGSLLQRLTVSCGVACQTPARGSAPESLVEIADAALYQAKRSGRNRVAAENYRSDTPPAYPAKVYRHNLPQLHGERVGRAPELQQIRKLVRNSRLLTVCGPAGNGKSREAIEAALRDIGRYPDGVFYVDCSPVTNGNYLWSKIGAVVGVRENSLLSAGSAVTEYLQSKRALLILDNCHTVAETAAGCARMLLSQTRDLRILATAREPLFAPGEVAYVLPPLGLQEAVDLFCVRAREVRGTAVPDSERDVVEAICAHLEGLPRAIELAAAQLAAFDLNELLSRLPDRAELGRETVRGFVKWSVDVLPPAEQQLLLESAVFAGGATLEALRAVCRSIEPLTTLVEKSLVTVEFNESGERYVLPASVRTFCIEELRARGDWESVSMRHAVYYRERVRELEAAQSTKQWRQTLEAMIPELDNLRAALIFTVTQAHDVQLGAELSCDLVNYWQHLGRSAAGREWLEQLLIRTDVSYSDALRAKLLTGVAHLDTSRSKRALEAAMAAVSIYRELGDERGLAAALFEVGAACTGLGDIDAAKLHLEETLSIAQRIADVRRTADVLNLIATGEGWRGNTDRAKALLQQSLTLFRSIDDDRGAASILGNLGDLAATAGEYEEAIALARQSLAILERLHDAQSTAWQLVNLGGFELKRGNADAARPRLRRAIELLREYPDDWLAANALDYLSRLAVAEGDWARGLRLAGFADSALESIGVPRQPPDQLSYDRVVRDAAVVLGEEKARKEMDRGRTMGWPQAVREAIDV
jgi:diguanylate cyclase (GGDEF)-like protein